MLIHEMLKNTESLSPSERILADYLLEEEDSIQNLSVRDICSKTYTNTSALIRLCKKMGFKGYVDFRNEYLKEIRYMNSHFCNIDVNYPFKKNDTMIEVSRSIANLYKESADDTLSLIQQKCLSKAIKIIKDSRRIHLVSVGTGLVVGNSFRTKMQKIGKEIVFSENPNYQYYDAYNADKCDCFIIISYSGETNSMLQIIQKLKINKIPTIAITSLGSNTISNNADVTLHLTTREKLYSNLGNYSTVVSTMLILDIIYSCLFLEDYDRNLNYKIEQAKRYERKRKSDNDILREDK